MKTGFVIYYTVYAHVLKITIKYIYIYITIKYIYAHVLHHPETYVTYATYCPQVQRLRTTNRCNTICNMCHLLSASAAPFPRAFLVKCMWQLAFGRPTGAILLMQGAILLMQRPSTQLIASTASSLKENPYLWLAILPHIQLSKPIHTTGVYSFLKRNHTCC